MKVDDRVESTSKFIRKKGWTVLADEIDSLVREYREMKGLNSELVRFWGLRECQYGQEE